MFLYNNICNELLVTFKINKPINFKRDPVICLENYSKKYIFRTGSFEAI